LKCVQRRIVDAHVPMKILVRRMTIVRRAEENTTKVKDGANMAKEATTITIQMSAMARDGDTINLIKIHMNNNK